MTQCDKCPITRICRDCAIAPTPFSRRCLEIPQRRASWLPYSYFWITVTVAGQRRTPTGLRPVCAVVPADLEARICSRRGRLNPTTTWSPKIVTGTPVCPEARIISIAAARSVSTYFSVQRIPCCERNSFTRLHQGQVCVEYITA